MNNKKDNKIKALRSLAKEIIQRNIRERLLMASIKKTFLTVTTIPVEIADRKYKVDIIEHAIYVVDTGNDAINKSSIMINRKDLTDIVYFLDYYNDIKHILDASQEYINKKVLSVNNTLEKLTDTLDLFDKTLTKANNDASNSNDTNVLNISCIVGKLDNGSPLIVQTSDTVFRQSASICHDVITSDDSDTAKSFQLFQKLENFAKGGKNNFEVWRGAQEILSFANIMSHFNLNKSIMPIINDYMLLTGVTNIDRSSPNIMKELVEYAKQHMSPIKSKYTRKGMCNLPDLKGNFEINGLNCEWNISSVNYDFVRYFSINKDVIDTAIEKSGIQDIGSFLQNYSKKGEANIFCDLMHNKIGRKDKEMYLKWTDVASAIYSLAFFSRLINDNKQEDWGMWLESMQNNIFNSIREQIDSQISQMQTFVGNTNNNVDAISTIVDKECVKKISGAEILRTISNINKLIGDHLNIYGNDAYHSSHYMHRLLLPENFMIDGRAMHVAVEKNSYSNSINIIVEVDGAITADGRETRKTEITISAGLLSGKIKPDKYGYNFAKQSIEHKAINLILTNVSQFVYYLLDETKSHLEKNVAKINFASESLCDAFPEDYMSHYLSINVM